MKYHLKLLFSPAKWLCCLVFMLAIPVVMYVPTYYDFVNVATLYFPFVGIVLFADVNLLDDASDTEEIVYLANRRPISTFLIRYAITVGLLLGYLVCANGLFRATQLLEGEIPKEPISLLEYLLSAACGCLYLGTLATLTGKLSGNVYIGYGCTCVFWVYWNVNFERKSWLNPFPFIASPAAYERPMAVIYCLVFALLCCNCYLCGKSPFFVRERIRRVRCR